MTANSSRVSGIATRFSNVVHPTVRSRDIEDSEGQFDRTVIAPNCELSDQHDTTAYLTVGRQWNEARTRRARPG
jgi:hypothetical protein